MLRNDTAPGEVQSRASRPGDRGWVADAIARLTAEQRRSADTHLIERFTRVDPDTVMAGWDVVVSSSVLPEAGPSFHVWRVGPTRREDD